MIALTLAGMTTILRMPTEPCASCTGPLSEGQLVCHRCGFPTTAFAAAADERLALLEARQAMASALQLASAQGGDEAPIRNRFLRNMPVPRTAEMLVDEILECERHLSDSAGADNAAAEERCRACLNRLEVLAVDSPELRPRIDVLATQLGRHRSRLARSNWIMGVSVVAVLAGGVALLLWILSLVARAFGR